MAKFKAGDQVRNIQDDHNYIPFGQTGVVKESDDHAPFVDWGDPYGRWPQNETYLELLTEPSSPTPEMGPVEGTLEWWRFRFAGQAMHGLLCAQYADTSKCNLSEVPKESVKIADALIAELKKGGKP